MSNKQYIGDELSLFSQALNWKLYWSAKLQPLVTSPVLEVGAGIGSNTRLLNNNFESWLCLEPDQKQSDMIKRGLPLVESLCGTLIDLPKDRTFKTILYIDVLEHIQDDKAEVQSAFDKLTEGGRLIVLAPAHQNLFSPFDDAVGHYRRYNTQSLEALTPTQNDRPAFMEANYYLDSVGFLASWANSLFLRQSMPTKRQIWLWDKLMIPSSRIVDPLIRNKLGKTVVGVWQRTKPSE